MTEKLQCGSPVHAIEPPRIGFVSSGRPSSARRGDGLLGRRVRDVREHEVLLTRDARLTAEAVEELAERVQLLAGDESEVHGNPDRRQPVLLLRLDADVVGELAVEGREREVGQRIAEPLLDLGAHAFGPDVVDHELHARLDARDAVAEVLAPRVEQRAQHGDGLVGPDEDPEVARDAGNGGEAAADEHAEARLPVAEDADERDAVDLRREASVGARADCDLVLAGKVDVVRMTREEGMRFLHDGRGVEQLVVGDPGDRAAGDRAHRVAAAAEARQPGRVQLLEDVRELGEAQVVQLDVLPRGELRLASAVVEREAARSPAAAPESAGPRRA